MSKHVLMTAQIEKQRLRPKGQTHVFAESMRFSSFSTVTLVDAMPIRKL